MSPIFSIVLILALQSSCAARPDADPANTNAGTTLCKRDFMVASDHFFNKQSICLALTSGSLQLSVAAGAVRLRAVCCAMAFRTTGERAWISGSLAGGWSSTRFNVVTGAGGCGCGCGCGGADGVGAGGLDDGTRIADGFAGAGAGWSRPAM
jgi:hypothetical protein